MSAAIVLHTNHSILAHPIGVETPASGDGLARSRAYLNTHNGMGEKVAPEGHDPRTVAPGAVGGVRTPGQLWERVAEASERTFRNVWRGGMTRGRPVCIAATGYKGILGRHVCGDHHSHGIIRAGKRTA